MSTQNITTQKVNFKVFRFNADVDYLPYYESYTMEVTSAEVVLDILNRIKWDLDGSFSYRRSCRHGICGACAINLNGRATLVCKENMYDMIKLFGKEITLEPLSIKRAVKDLIIDKADFWQKHDVIKPYLISDVDEHPEHEHIVTPEQVDALYEADLCIQCGACHYACPVVQINDDFIGPAAFTKAYRFEADIRDDAHTERLLELHEEGQGIWDCIKCFECAESCPKDINPIDKITKLHQILFRKGVATSNVATRHAVGFKNSIAKYGLLNESTLILYSEGPTAIKHIPVALQMFRKGKFIMPWNMPKSDNLDEIQKLIKSSSTTKF